MSYRKKQIESTLQRAICQVLARRLSDPRVVGMVSVTHVDVSPDRRNAFVYVSVLPDKYEKRSLGGLNGAAGHIYSLVCKHVAMRMVPRLEFRLDKSLKKQENVYDAIRRGIDQDNTQRLAREQVEHAEAGTDLNV